MPPKKTGQIGVRVSPDDRVLLEKAAKRAQRKLSDWAHVQLVAAAVAEAPASYDVEEDIILEAVETLRRANPLLLELVLQLGADAIQRPRLARLLKELAALDRDAEPEEIGSPAQRHRRRKPRKGNG